MTGGVPGAVWAGSLVSAALGIRIQSDPQRSLVPVERLVGLALRKNPKRAHLLVSTVLAKHVPTVPATAVAAGGLLGLLVAKALDATQPTLPTDIRALADRLTAVLAGDPDADPAALRDDVRRLAASLPPAGPAVVTLGYAETATGLGQLVADTLGSYYLHSTRHAPAGAQPFAGFAEEHSHATAHQLYPTDPGWLKSQGTVVLVDDELSTGTTIINTIRALQAVQPQARWVVASLVDLRSAGDRSRFDELAGELGTSIQTVAIGAGSIELPPDVLAKAEVLLAAMTQAGPWPAEAEPTGRSVETQAGDAVVDASGRVSLVEVYIAPVRSARFGVGGPPDPAVVDALTDAVLPLLPPYGAGGGACLVLGSEEFIALPLAVADRLDDTGNRGGATRRIAFSTTTRSPIAAFDRPDYAIASAETFTTHDVTGDDSPARFAYNLCRDGRRFDAIVFVPEPGTDRARLEAPGGVIDALRRVTDHVIVPLAVEPMPLVGPAFGSYSADDVQWLLQDLKGARLEAPAEERESKIQSGEANYAESLPIEYLPSPEYEQLYREALSRSSRRVAIAVGVVTELVLAARGDRPVLVSLARAGTPIGILMRRWANRMRGIDAPHYTMSIVRGVGVDTTALRYLAAHHDPSQIAFVDGWTGKGAIARELTAALALFAETDGIVFGDDLAVLADPGHSVTTFGTRDDYLIPSACLNSTVSGLVSRTVFNRQLIGENEFHGAKFYSELAANDVSEAFLDAVCEHFEEVADEVRDELERVRSSDRAVTWAGWTAVERISADYGIHNINLVKPGVGETTRVLLRRVPWKVLVRPDAQADVAHVVLLAHQRGVAVELVDGLAYSCVGLIHPVTGRAPGGEQ